MRTISRVILASVAMAALIVMAQAQDKPKSPWEIVVSGDTLEAMKVSIALHEKVDQSTPEGVAAAYCMLADDRAAVKDMEAAARDRWNKLLYQAMKPHEQQLLSAEAFEALVKLRAKSGKDDTYSNRRAASKIAAVDKIDDQNVWVTCTQESIITRRKTPDADPETERNEEKMRLHVRKGNDGKWRIQSRQAWQVSWESIDEGEEEYVWEKSETVLWSLLYFEQLKPVPVAKLDQSTPESAARSLFEWLAPTKENFELGAAGKFLAVWSSELKALHTQDYIDSCTETAKRNAAESEARKADQGPRVVESVTEGEDGLKVVKIKQRYESLGAIELRLKQDGEVWKIVSGGYYERDWKSEDKEALRFVPVPDIYQLAWR